MKIGISVAISSFYICYSVDLCTLSVNNTTFKHSNYIHFNTHIYIYILKHTNTHTHTHTHTYIYIYISLKKKPKTGYFRIINLFPSCFSFLVWTKKHEEIYNRTSSDLMDKKKQNRHGGWKGEGESWRVTSSFYWISVFLFTYLFYFQNSSVSYNYGNLTYLFILFYSFSFLVKFDK